jgi:putative transcriptional regulator
MDTNSNDSLKNHFLIAMPAMEDPNFSHSITYICEHNEDGAMGIMINRPLNLSLGEIFEHLDIDSYDEQFDHQNVLEGGPVQTDMGFVLHRNPQEWQSTVVMEEGICLTTSRDILDDIANNKGPKDSLIALGYAGWGGGQLEEEMQSNAWITVKADPEILFSIPHEKRWEAATKLLGIDLSLMSSDVGHS